MTETVTSVSSSTTSAQAIAADGTRTSLVFENTDGNRAYLLAGSGTATTVAGGFTFSLVENGTATLTPPDSQLEWQVIWAGDSTGGLTITAITNPVSDSNGASITTYAQLKTAIAAWLRPNSAVSSDMTTNIPKYIGLAEVMIRRELHLRALDQVDTALAIDDGVAAVPTGFLSVLSMTLVDDPYNQIRALPLDQLEKLDPTLTYDKPYYYTRSGSSFLFYPKVDATARLRFRRGVTPLSADEDTNWILAGHPDIYLYGSLLHADRRLIGPRLGEWKEGFAQGMESLARLERDLHTDALYPQPNGMVA